MTPVRDRLVPGICVLVGAPVCAEYLQAYLPSTGDALVMVGGLTILGPLYGGAALVIREVAVRRGLGWTGTLLLAGGFGVAMTGVIDLSLFAERSPEVTYWEEMREGTLIAPLGLSAYCAVTWPVGHVLMSVGAPLALLGALAPRHRGRSLLGPCGLATTTALFVGAAVLINVDAARQYDYRPSLAQTTLALAAVAGLVAAALSRAGRPVVARAARPASLLPLVAAGAGGIVAFDLVPWTWPGVAASVVLLAGTGVAARRRAGRSGLGALQIGALAAGGLVGRGLSSFLSPVPEGVPDGVKVAQNVVLLAGTLGVTWLVLRRARRRSSPPASPPGPGAPWAERPPSARMYEW